MSAEEPEPALPYTQSHTGRGARVGYLGMEGVGFEELWPLFAGLILSLAAGLHLFLGAGSERGGWIARTVMAASPTAAGFGYLRLLVQGRPPHFKGDLLERAVRLRPDFSGRWPRLRADTSDAGGPERAADLAHPLSRRRGWRGPR